MTGTDDMAAEPARRQADEAQGAGDVDAARPGVPHVHVVEDVAVFELDDAAAVPVYRARWQLFLPTAAIALLYAAAWTYLYSTGRSDFALARLVIIVMAIGVPLLAAHAFLRYATIRLQVLANAVRYHPGWPRDLPVDMPFELIERVRVKRGLSGLIFGGGTLVMDLTTGAKAAVADLADPDGARAQVEKRLAVVAP
ncbi:MAG: hypothetical protein BroJett030_28620 [Alphaproteobacteria bacterium]|nr:MAG: hypothetical protein BroJett030_28620 [Alphaproteobacteria bacterium]